MPQFRDLELWLGRGWIDPLSSSRYAVFRVHYSRPVVEKPLLRRGTWTLDVQAVRRESRHTVQIYLLQTGLPLVAAWLTERASLHQRWFQTLTFLFDEEDGSFHEERETKLQPGRG